MPIIPNDIPNTPNIPNNIGIHIYNDMPINPTHPDITNHKYYLSMKRSVNQEYIDLYNSINDHASTEFINIHPLFNELYRLELELEIESISLIIFNGGKAPGINTDRIRKLVTNQVLGILDEIQKVTG